MASTSKGSQTFSIQRLHDNSLQPLTDLLIDEKLIQLQVLQQGASVAQAELLVVTLCTPIQLPQMVLGYLFSEQLIEAANDVEINCYLDQPEQVYIRFLKDCNWRQSMRHQLQHAGCGYCSKSHLESYQSMINRKPRQAMDADWMNLEFIQILRAKLIQQTVLFNQSGGCHAAAIVTSQGDIQAIAEDVGRHNAVDKVVGMALQQDLNCSSSLLWVSGRAGFELVAKAVTAGFNGMLSVGAPSSMSLTLARQAGLNLIGFIKQDSFNIYNQL